jgi:hypothetical protein
MYPVVGLITEPKLPPHDAGEMLMPVLQVVSNPPVVTSHAVTVLASRYIYAMRVEVLMLMDLGLATAVPPVPVQEVNTAPVPTVEMTQDLTPLLEVALLLTRA